MQARFDSHSLVLSCGTVAFRLSAVGLKVVAGTGLPQIGSPAGIAGQGSKWIRGLSRWAWGGLAGCFTALGLHAEGIPEPGLVIYGVVRNVQGGVTNRLTSGSLTCQITPSSGGPITVVTPLQNINEQYSYVLKVPFESRIAGLSLTPEVLELTAGTNRLQRAFMVNGTNASFAVPTQESFAFTPADRARQERVDLFVGLEAVDSNHNGIPDWWERYYFGRLIDASEDPDGDRLTNLAEYIAGTDPTNQFSAFKFINVRQDSVPGLVVEWSSVSNRVYSVLRSTEVLGSYTIIRSNLPATPPVNTFRDTNTLPIGSTFYRLLVR